jgi:hypothetical protein
LLGSGTAHSGDMSMYVTLLSKALDLWDTDLDDDALLEYVRACRAALPSRGLGAGTLSATVVAAEIVYDRALVCLAARYGVDVSPRNFVHPKIERERLEFELVRHGIEVCVQVSEPVVHTDSPRS